MTEHVDVCILGGGIVGLFCAAELADAGFVIRLIDKNYAGSSRENIGDITLPGHAPLLDEFVGFSNQCWQESGVLLAQGIGLMPTGSIQLALNDADFAALEQAYQRDKVSKINSYLEKDRDVWQDVLGAVELSESCVGARFISRDLMVDAHTALDNLRQHLIQKGVRIWGADIVQEFFLDKAGNVRGVVTDGGDVCMAENTIVCTGTRTTELLAPLNVEIPIRPSRSHIVEMTPNGHLPMAMVVYAAEKGYLRIRRTPEGKALVAYDGILDADQATYSQEPHDETVAWMKEKAAELLPALKDATVTSSRVLSLSMTPDFAPCIGRYGQREGLLLAVGMNGRSYAYASGAARIVRHILMDDPYPLNIAPFQADRFANKTWTPTALDDVLPTYATAVMVSDEKEVQRAGNVAMSEDPEVQRMAVGMQEDDAAPTELPDIQMTEKHIQRGEKETVLETAEAQADLPDVAMTGKDVTQQNADIQEVGKEVTASSADPTLVGKDVAERELAEIQEQSKEVIPGSENVNMTGKDVTHLDTKPVMVEKHIERASGDVEMVEHHLERAGQVNMVEKKITRQLPEIGGNLKHTQTAPVNGEEKKKPAQIKEKSEQKAQVSYGAAGLVKKS